MVTEPGTSPQGSAGNTVEQATTPGEPTLCPHCGNMYRGWVGLSAHHRRTHPTIPYTAPVCPCGEKAKARGLCSRCYDVARYATRSICDCGGRVYATGMCRSCYAKEWRRNRICNVTGCTRNQWRHGYCHGHYNRWQRTGDPGPAELRRWRRQTETCTAPGCTLPPKARNLCRKHWSQWFRGTLTDQPRRWLLCVTCGGPLSVHRLDGSCRIDLRDPQSPTADVARRVH